MGIFDKVKDIEVKGGGNKRQYPNKEGKYLIELTETGNTESRETGDPVMFASYTVREVLESRGESLPVNAEYAWTVVVNTKVAKQGGKIVGVEPTESGLKALGKAKQFVMAFSGFGADDVDTELCETFFGVDREDHNPEMFAGNLAVMTVRANVSQKNGQTYYNTYFDAFETDGNEAA